MNDMNDLVTDPPVTDDPLRISRPPSTVQPTPQLLEQASSSQFKQDKAPALTSKVYQKTGVNTERELLLKHFSDKLIVNPVLTRQLVSFQASKSTPFYRWLKYKEAFSTTLVDYLYDLLPVSKTARHVLDPFAGTGTALTRACARNWSATGIELLPVGANALRARMDADVVNIEEFEKSLKALQRKDLAAIPSTYKFPHLRITIDAFSSDTELELSGYVAFINGLKDKQVRFLFWFAALSVLEDVSFTRKDGQYLRWDQRSGRPSAKEFDKGKIPNFSNAVSERLQAFLQDLTVRNGGAFSKRSHVIEGSCLLELSKLDAEQFDVVLTSPPYCNRYDYTRTYALELAFCGSGEEDIRRLRQTLLSATVENKSKQAELRKHYEKLGILARFETVCAAFDRQRALHEVLTLLRNARDKGELSNPNVPNLVENYFFEMSLVIFELARTLKKGGRVFMVNDNVRYHGEEVPVDLILNDFAESAGLVVERIWVLPRGKGNSSQQMGKWGRVELRKCVYCWNKP